MSFFAAFDDGSFIGSALHVFEVDGKGLGTVADIEAEGFGGIRTNTGSLAAVGVVLQMLEALPVDGAILFKAAGTIFECTEDLQKKRFRIRLVEISIRYFLT